MNRRLSHSFDPIGLWPCLAWLLTAPAALAQPQGPVIEHIEPTSGPPGTEVAIVGRYFGPGSQVSVNATALPVTELLPNRITVRVPEGAGTGFVRVQTAAGSRLGPEFRVTAPLPAPRIAAIEPTSAPPGGRVIIRGENFSPRLTKNLVTLSGVPVLVRSATPTALEVTVPESAASGPFVVAVTQAGEARSEPLSVTAGTSITDFRPRRGGPGSEVVVSGTGFSERVDDNRVFLNNVPAKVKAASKAQLTVELPRRAVSGKLLVDVRGAGRAETPEPFVVQQPPTVTDFSPRSGAAGALIAVRGTAFGNDPQAVEARLGEQPLVVRKASETRLSLEIPAGTEASGRLSIRVSGVGPAWSDGEFIVQHPLLVQGFEPRQGAPGTLVTIHGAGFGSEPRRNVVRFGRRTAEVVEASAKALVVRAPKAGTGPVAVSVGGRTARSAAAFVVTSPPMIRKVAPSEAVVGAELRIHGHGFGNNPSALKVRLAGQELELRSVRDDAVVVRLTGAPRAGVLEVEVALQGKAVAPGEVRARSALAVGAPEPLSARVGETIELPGKGFEPTGMVVEFGGVASSPTQVESERLRVVVPEGARSGLVTVRLSDGQAAPSPSAFTVISGD